MSAHGPYETEPFDEAQEVGRDEEGKFYVLRRALDGAGVELGAFDQHILRWLARSAPTTILAVAGWIERASHSPHYPRGSYVATTVRRPYHGQIIYRIESGQDRVLWECRHDHPTGADAAACAGREIEGTGGT